MAWYCSDGHRSSFEKNSGTMICPSARYVDSEEHHGGVEVGKLCSYPPN